MAFAIEVGAELALFGDDNLLPFTVRKAGDKFVAKLDIERDPETNKRIPRKIDFTELGNFLSDVQGGGEDAFKLEDAIEPAEAEPGQPAKPAPVVYLYALEFANASGYTTFSLAIDLKMDGGIPGMPDDVKKYFDVKRVFLSLAFSSELSPQGDAAVTKQLDELVNDIRSGSGGGLQVKKIQVKETPPEETDSPPTDGAE